MIERWLPLGLFAGVMLVGLAVISFYQSRSYRRYLAAHTAETAKVTENLRAQLAAQQEMNSLLTRQTAAMERIAAALEAKGGHGPASS